MVSRDESDSLLGTQVVDLHSQIVGPSDKIALDKREICSNIVLCVFLGMILGMICERFRLFFKCYESSECVDLLSLSVILVYFVSNFAFVLVFVHMFMCFVCVLS